MNNHRRNDAFGIPLSSQVTGLLPQVRRLSDEDFEEFMVAALDKRRPASVQKAVIKRLGRKGRNHAESTAYQGEGVVEAGTSSTWPNAGSGSLASKSAWKSPFIYRGDCIPEDGLLFLDVEKLSLKIPNNDSKHQMVASSVAVVNSKRDLILWSFVKWDQSLICQTFENMTGITKEKREIGQDIQIVSHFADLAFQGNTIVGYDMKNDLQALRVNAIRQLDLSEYYIDRNRQKIALKDLAKHFLKKDYFQCSIHSAIQDARVTRDLYFKMLDLQKTYPDFTRYPEEIQRSPKTFEKDPNDVCRCKRKARSGKKKINKTSKYFVPYYEDDDAVNEPEEFSGAFRPE